jgi:hypothetical protein
MAGLFQLARQAEDVLLRPGYQPEGGFFRPKTGGGKMEPFLFIRRNLLSRGITGIIKEKGGQITGFKRKKGTIGEFYTSYISPAPRFYGVYRHRREKTTLPGRFSETPRSVNRKFGSFPPNSTGS